MGNQHHIVSYGMFNDHPINYTFNPRKYWKNKKQLQSPMQCHHPASALKLELFAVAFLLLYQLAHCYEVIGLWQTDRLVKGNMVLVSWLYFVSQWRQKCVFAGSIFNHSLRIPYKTDKTRCKAHLLAIWLVLKRNNIHK